MTPRECHGDTYYIGILIPQILNYTGKMMEEPTVAEIVEPTNDEPTMEQEVPPSVIDAIPEVAGPPKQVMVATPLDPSEFFNVNVTTFIWEIMNEQVLTTRIQAYLSHESQIANALAQLDANGGKGTKRYSEITQMLHKAERERSELQKFPVGNIKFINERVGSKMVRVGTTFNTIVEERHVLVENGKVVNIYDRAPVR